MAARGVLLLALIAGGCAVVTEFDPGRLTEVSESLCADGLDNDGNGLLDCQEFGCLATQSCCVLPHVYFADHFESADCALDSCDSPDRDGSAPVCVDTSLWQAWGSPFPRVCEGTLDVDKRENSYEIGVRSLQALRLATDLRITVGLTGTLTGAARRSVSLTLQTDIQGARDPGVWLVTVEPILGLVAEATTDGYHLVARFDTDAVGTSAVVTDQKRHEAAIRFGLDGRVHFFLDGQEFAASPADLPAPLGVDAYLALSGVGPGARFDDVTVTAQTQCDAPDAWTPALQPLTLPKPLPYNTDWDGFSLAAPAVLALDVDGLELYYVGCGNGLDNVSCLPERLGVGMARSEWGDPFAKATPQAPLLRVTDLQPVGATALDVGVAVLRGEPRWLLSTDEGILLYRRTADASGLEPVIDTTPVVPRGPSGAWDDAAVCCGTALEGADGVVRLWYAAQSSADSYPVWRVGLATSTDGASFTKSDRNPVLREGALEDFDGRGATAPDVAYDAARGLYRLWYGAHAFLTGSTIGYAVSADGVDWHKFPGNPVVTPDLLGLETVGAPAALVLDGEIRLWVQGREPGSHGTLIYEVTNIGRDYAPAE